MRVLVTGGAGFVGSSLALMLKRDLPDLQICAFDNLKRRGSELALARLREGAVEFIHGDVRCPSDLADAGPFQLLLECSAEPSVHAGYAADPAYVLDTNLAGTVHCLEAARRSRAGVIFLSTSRVYPIAALSALPLKARAHRFELPEGASGLGWSSDGVTVEFPLHGARSLYGATKLASELLIEEYRAMFGLSTVVLRCGVIAGPWQMGKVDQGFVVLWASRHEYGGSLTYVGFGGEGLQVRDVLHVADLYDLMRLLIEDLDRHSGAVYNVGGGRANSVSLVELTARCRERSKQTIPIAREPRTSRADVPYYVADNAAVTRDTGWAPHRGLEDVLDDIFSWLRAHRPTIEPVLNAGGGRMSAPVRSS